MDRAQHPSAHDAETRDELINWRQLSPWDLKAGSHPQEPFYPVQSHGLPFSFDTPNAQRASQHTYIAPNLPTLQPSYDPNFHTWQTASQIGNFHQNFESRWSDSSNQVRDAAPTPLPSIKLQITKSEDAIKSLGPEHDEEEDGLAEIDDIRTVDPRQLTQKADKREQSRSRSRGRQNSREKDRTCVLEVIFIQHLRKEHRTPWRDIASIMRGYGYGDASVSTLQMRCLRKAVAWNRRSEQQADWLNCPKCSLARRPVDGDAAAAGGDDA